MRAGTVVRRLRLATGLVLFAYLVTHYANHALGLVSLAAMEAGRRWFAWLWDGWPGGLLLGGALTLHLVLALWALYVRRSLGGMRRWEAGQLLLGLAVPPLLAIHLLGTKVAALLFGTDPLYAYLLLVLWVYSPWIGLQQAVLVLVAWCHGCLGLHFWLRIRPWYGRVRLLLFSVALLLPVLALLGFAEAGREVARLNLDPAWRDQAAAAIHFPTADQVALVYRLQAWCLWGFGALVAAVLAARLVRDRLVRRAAIVVAYPDGRKVEVPRGTTILEASRIGGIPHASVCGGRGRCSTCRVRIAAGLAHLPPVSPEERRVLDRVGAPPNVRLASRIEVPRWISTLRSSG